MFVPAIHLIVALMSSPANVEHVGSQPTAHQITVRFSDGTRMTVAPHALAVDRKSEEGSRE